MSDAPRYFAGSCAPTVAYDDGQEIPYLHRVDRPDVDCFLYRPPAVNGDAPITQYRIDATIAVVEKRAIEALFGMLSELRLTLERVMHPDDFVELYAQAHTLMEQSKAHRPSREIVGTAWALARPILTHVVRVCGVSDVANHFCVLDRLR